MGWWCALVMFVALAGFLPPSAFAATLFGVDSLNKELVTIDLVTGNTTVVGSLDSAVFAMASDAQGNLFGAAFPTNSGSELRTINLQTAAASFVAPLGNSPTRILGFAFGPEGTLYGVDIDNHLLTLDTTTGKSDIIGSLGLSSGFTFGLEFDADGILYAVTTFDAPARLLTIDLITGAATVVGPLGFPFPSADYGLAFDRESGQLFAAGNQQFLTIDRTTGRASLIGPLNLLALTSLAFVPEPTTGLLVGLGIAALVSTRRRAFLLEDSGRAKSR